MWEKGLREVGGKMGLYRWLTLSAKVVRNNKYCWAESRGRGSAIGDSHSDHHNTSNHTAYDVVVTSS
jgi:hypothetical protein